MIYIAQPSMGPEEERAVMAVLRSGMLAQGPKVAELEKHFAKFCGTDHAVAVNSGTAALHAALFAAGIGPGDEVITTPFSFIATLNCILMVGAKPVLADIDPHTFNLDPKGLEKVITPKTKAILPVHLFGQSCDYAELDNIAKKHNLLVIEDACQAVGATYEDTKTGNLGDMGCFSLYATKNIVSGEGGMVTTNNPAYADAVRRFRQHGMSSTYEYEHLGFNYRMSDVLAAIAIEQLGKIESFTAARQRNAKTFDEGLAGLKGIERPRVAPGRTHVYNQYTVRVTKAFPLTRDETVQALKKRGIVTGVYYHKAMHTYDYTKKLGYKEGDFPKAEEDAREVLSLTVHPRVSEADAQTIVAAMKELAGE